MPLIVRRSDERREFFSFCFTSFFRFHIVVRSTRLKYARARWQHCAVVVKFIFFIRHSRIFLTFSLFVFLPLFGACGGFCIPHTVADSTSPAQLFVLWTQDVSSFTVSRWVKHVVHPLAFDRMFSRFRFLRFVFFSRFSLFHFRSLS